MPYWWVNQGQTWAEEYAGSYLWSPKRNRAGGRNRSYDLMPEVARGDVVFHHAAKAVRSVSRVVRGGYSYEQPVELAVTARWHDDGWRVDVAHAREVTPVPSAVLADEFPDEDCFGSTGRVNQAYLFALTVPFGRSLESRLGSPPDAAVPASHHATPPPRTVDLEAGRRLEFERAPTSQVTTAVRREWSLVDRFVESTGVLGARRRYDLPGGTTLFADLWLDRERILVEAKSDAGRSAVRIAIGQLADYESKEDGPVRKLLLLPEAPADDLLAVLHRQRIVACWPSSEGWERSDHGRNVWPSGSRAFRDDEPAAGG